MPPLCRQALFERWQHTLNARQHRYIELAEDVAYLKPGHWLSVCVLQVIDEYVLKSAIGKTDLTSH